MTRKEAIKRLKEIEIRDALQEDYDSLCMAIEALEQLTSYERTINKLTKAISEQGPKTGRWIYLRNERNSFVQVYECSVCGWKIDSCRGLMQDTGHRLFCEHCGAKMVEPQEEELKHG